MTLLPTLEVVICPHEHGAIETRYCAMCHYLIGFKGEYVNCSYDEESCTP
jgi:hypothetical protein